MPQGVLGLVEASTAHLSLDEFDVLTRWSECESTAAFRTVRHDWGWLVYISRDDEEREAAEDAARQQGMQAGFFAVLDYARQYGCTWVDFDQDADAIDSLPILH